jgi:hypothetical protein
LSSLSRDGIIRAAMVRRGSIVRPNARAWRAREPKGSAGSNPALSASSGRPFHRVAPFFRKGVLAMARGEMIDGHSALALLCREPYPEEER